MIVMVHGGYDSAQFPAYQKTDPIESWAHPQKYLVFEGNTCYRFRPPRKHLQKINLYRMGCPRLSLVFFLGIQIPLNLRAPFCTCCWFAWFGTALNLPPPPPLPCPKKAVKFNLGCPYSVLSIFFDFSWGFIFCSPRMGRGGWEPDSVRIKSGPPRSNWNFQGDVASILKPVVSCAAAERNLTGLGWFRQIIV